MYQVLWHLPVGVEPHIYKARRSLMVFNVMIECSSFFREFLFTGLSDDNPFASSTVVLINTIKPIF